MAGQDPSPQTTLLILLGASRWPRSGLVGSTAFEKAKSELRNYFVSDPKGFNLPKSNILDLFDLDDSNTNILNRISVFLRDRIKTKKQSNDDIRDVLVYYIGHGGITKDSSIFYLAIRRTQEEYEKATSIAMDDLAERLKNDARFQRRILILDCCFAAQALRFLQGSEPATFVSIKTIAAFEEKDQGEGIPSRGTSFLASSGKGDASFILPNETSTKFTSALLSALRTGDRYQEGERLSLHTVYRLTEDFLRKTYGNDFPRPELHSPDQTQGDIATKIAFFPNPSAGVERARLAEEERVGKAEEGRRRQAEAERARLAEEERVRKAEEDRRRQAEAERARLAEEERVKKAEEERRIQEAGEKWVLRPLSSSSVVEDARPRRLPKFFRSLGKDTPDTFVRKMPSSRSIQESLHTQRFDLPGIRLSPEERQLWHEDTRELTGKLIKTGGKILGVWILNLLTFSGGLGFMFDPPGIRLSPEEQQLWHEGTILGVSILNLLITSVGLGILLHTWWIAVVCFIGELLLTGIVLGSLQGSSWWFIHKREARAQSTFLLIGLLPVGIAWGLVGWFLNPFVSLWLHFPYSTMILAGFGFLLGLFVNFFISLLFVRGLRPAWW